MAMKDSAYKRLTTGINSDDIGSILTEAKKSVADGTIALSLLVTTNQLVYKAVKQKANCKSSDNDIVELCELCCSIITSNWTPSIKKTRIYGSLYHIINYLMLKGHKEHINKIFNYIFIIHEKSSEDENGAENQEEKNILKNLILCLVINIKNSLKEYCDCLVSKSEESLLTFCKLIIKVDRLCDYSNNSTFITFLHSVSSFCHINHHDDLLTFQKYCLKMLTPNIVQNFDLLLRFLYSMISEWIKSSSQNECNILFEYIKAFENYVDDKSKKMFSLLYNVILFLTSKPEEAKFMQIVNECNLIAKDWRLSNENQPTIVTSFNSVIFVLLKMRSKWLTLVSSSNLSMHTLEQFFQFFNSVYDVLKRHPSEICVLPTGEKCLLKADKTLINCQYLILELILYCGKNCNDTLKQCYPHAVMAQKECLHWLEQMKQLKCPMLLDTCNWVFTSFGNISRLLSSEDELDFITAAFKFLLTLPSEILHTSDFAIRGLCLTLCLTKIMHKSGKLDQILIVLTAFLSVSIENEVSVFNLWSDFKYNQIVEKREEHLELTIYDIITERKEELETNWTVCNFSKAQIVKFLTLEMQMYYKHSLLHGKPMLAAFNALQKLTDDVMLNCKALVMAMGVSSSSDKYSTELEKHKELSNKVFPLLKNQILNKKDSGLDGELEFIIGDVLHHQFRYDLRSVRSKSGQEIALSLKLYEHRNNQMMMKHFEDINPNDKCEVTPASTNISIKLQTTLLKKLDEAVKYWEIACSKITQKPEMAAVTLENICTSGYLYKLYCLKDKELACWKLLYTVSKKFGNIEMKIMAVSELLDIEVDLPPEWVQECLEDIDKLNIDSAVKSAFQINWVKRLLMHEKISECLPVIENFNSTWRSHKNTFVMALLKLNNFQSILSGIKFDNYLPSDIAGLQTSLSLCLGFTTVEDESLNFSKLSQIHDLGLQASHDLGLIYWNMKLPRQARCYLKSQITIAQKLALPLRTAQLLSLLTWLDLDCGNTSDAHVKLSGLETILEIEHSKTTEELSYSTSSPTFKKTLITLPDFLKHKENCKCFPCTNIEYQRLVLETFALQGEYSNLIGDKNNALHFFKVGFQILKIFEQKNIMSDAIKFSKIRLWLRYSTLQGMLQNYTEAIETLQKARQFLDAKDFFNNSEVFLSLYRLQSAQLIATPRKIPVGISMSSKENVKTPTKLKMNDFKPSVCLSQNKITASKKKLHSNGYITPAKPMRPLLFDLSDEDEDSEKYKENISNSQKKTKGKNKTPPKIVLHSPISLFPSLKKERNLFSVFSDESDSLPCASKKTYRKNQIKEERDSEKCAFPSNVKNKLESKKKLFNNIDKLHPKLNSTNNSLDVQFEHRNTRTATKVNAKNSTQISAFNRRCKNSNVLNLTEDKFSFDEMESALNDVFNSRGKVAESVPPKSAKRTLRPRNP